MRDSFFAPDETETLRAQLDNDGYLLLRGLLDVEEVLAVRRYLLADLSSKGYLDPTHPLDDAVLAKDSGFAAGEFGECAAPIDEPVFQKLLRQGALPLFFECFLGGPVRNLDRTILRSRAGNQWSATYPHCDSVFMGRGTSQLFTTWIPLGDVDYSLGGLIVLAGSHRSQSLRKSYCHRDVDEYCLNHPEEAALARAGKRPWDGKLSEDPTAAQQQLGGRWLTTHYQPGDVVVFPIYTVHASTDNQTGRIRLSIDTRFQRPGDPVDERWVGDQRSRPRPRLRGRIC
jgi:hypothetical protein